MGLGAFYDALTVQQSGSQSSSHFPLGVSSDFLYPTMPLELSLAGRLWRRLVWWYFWQPLCQVVDFPSPFARGLTTLGPRLPAISCFSYFAQRLAMLSWQTSIELDVHHIAEKRNVKADFLSRWTGNFDLLSSKWDEDFRVAMPISRLWMSGFGHQTSRYFGICPKAFLCLLSREWLERLRSLTSLPCFGQVIAQIAVLYLGSQFLTGASQMHLPFSVLSSLRTYSASDRQVKACLLIHVFAKSSGSSLLLVSYFFPRAMAFHAWVFTAFSFLVRYSLKPPLHIAFSSQDAFGALSSDRVKQICAGDNVTNCEADLCQYRLWIYTANDGLASHGSPTVLCRDSSAAFR